MASDLQSLLRHFSCFSDIQSSSPFSCLRNASSLPSLDLNPQSPSSSKLHKSSKTSLIAHVSSLDPFYIENTMRGRKTAEIEVQQLLHMNGQEDKVSYAENSSLQKMVIEKTKYTFKESIRELCNSNLPECVNVADLGCSSGPNAFLSVTQIIESIREAFHQLNHKPPTIQAFLNDLVLNDFNSLFKSLPSFYTKLEKPEDVGCQSKSCFIAAMPGSFYDRLFPDHSMHFVHSSNSLVWRSQVPAGLETESGEPLNKRNIFMAYTSPPSVHAAYMDQFYKDFTMFLRVRSKEMALPGHLTLTFGVRNHPSDGYEIWEFLGMAIDDMVKEGLIEEEKLATCSLPLYAPSVEEVLQIIEAEGSFKLRHLETFKLPWDVGRDSFKTREAHQSMLMRAVFEPLLANHFGESIMDDLFCKYGKKAAEYMETGKGTMNSVVLSLAKL